MTWHDDGSLRNSTQIQRQHCFGCPSEHYHTRSHWQWFLFIHSSLLLLLLLIIIIGSKILLLFIDWSAIAIIIINIMPPNYGAVEHWNQQREKDYESNNHDEEEVALLNANTNDATPTASASHDKKTKAWWLVLLLLLLVSLGIFLVFFFQDHASSSSSIVYPFASSAAKEQTTSLMDTNNAAVSSFQLDPVKDLQVIRVDRTELGIPQAIPSSVLTAAAADTHSIMGPLPTNRWYLVWYPNNNMEETRSVTIKQPLTPCSFHSFSFFSSLFSSLL